ncbi:MAG: signal peptide peptidase SppA, partial [Planctomycetota bacterium]
MSSLSLTKTESRSLQNLPRAVFARLIYGLLLLSLTGCAQRTFRHAGAVNMSGGMEVDGDVELSGGMEMGGELTTRVSLPADSRASSLRPVVVSGQRRDGRIAILDLDDLIVDRAPSGLVGSGESPVALFREKVDAIVADATIQAVVLRINSPGGGVTASDVVASELQRLRRQREIPVIASVLDVGAGGAYYLACQCDAIYAHPTSLIGGIGVILNVYNLQDTMGQFNVLASPIKSGDRIDAGTPQRPLEDGEMEMLQQIADQFHQRFIELVSQRRPAAMQTREQWSDGRVMTGQKANEIGLVDSVGYIDDAIAWARQTAQLAADS